MPFGQVVTFSGNFRRKLSRERLNFVCFVNKKAPKRNSIFLKTASTNRMGLKMVEVDLRLKVEV